MWVRNEPKTTSVARTAFGGAVAAMAMTAMRKVALDGGLIEEVPPDEMAEKGAPRLLARLSPSAQNIGIELAHWAYGAVAGATFDLLPRSARRQRWMGPAYGLGIWLLYEVVLAPLLGTKHQRRLPLRERLALMADHVLYGVIVSRTDWVRRPQ